MWALVCSKRGAKEWPISPERGPLRRLGEVHPPAGFLRQKTANFLLGPESIRYLHFGLGNLDLTEEFLSLHGARFSKISLLVMKQICPDPHIQRLSLGKKPR
jgi:hypothetical protein